MRMLWHSTWANFYHTAGCSHAGRGNKLAKANLGFQS